MYLLLPYAVTFGSVAYGFIVYVSSSHQTSFVRVLEMWIMVLNLPTKLVAGQEFVNRWAVSL